MNIKITSIVLSILIVMCTFIYGISYFYNKNQNLEKRLDLAEGLNEKCFEEVGTTNNLIKTVRSELENSKARIAGIKNHSDLLKRDIELYISSTYRTVPSVLAKSIAINVVDISKKEEISPELIVGIIQIESMFNPSAVGIQTKYGRARGLMQVMPEWAPKFGLSSQYDLHDIDTNIMCGVKVFKIHLEEGKGSISKGLYLYVNKDKAYVDKVYNAMGKFVSFRSTVDDDKKNEEVETNGDDEKEEDIKK